MIKPFLPDAWNGILVIGDRAAKQDLSSGMPFRSSDGLKLSRMLGQAGIQLNECAQCYAYPMYPKGGTFDSLFGNKTQAKKGLFVEKCDAYVDVFLAEGIDKAREWIAKLKPKFILGLGKGGTMVLTDNTSVDDWRGSMGEYEGIPFMITHSPDRINRQRQLDFLAKHDISRIPEGLNGWVKPEQRFILNLSFSGFMDALEHLHDMAKKGHHIAVDIETRFQMQISYIGFAWSREDAMCIPFLRPQNAGHYWTEEEHVQLVWKIKQILEEENVRVSGQNYHYDVVFLARHWGVRSHIWCDTMIAHHTCFSADLPKDLATLSSLYNEYYTYWKDESENHEPTPEGEQAYMEYNCKDCCNTWEIAEEMMKEGGILDQFELRAQWEFQHRQWHCLLLPILRGTKYSKEMQRRLKEEIAPRKAALVKFIEALVPPSCRPPMPKSGTKFYASTSQLCVLFYDILGQPVQTARRGPGVYTKSTDDKALKKIAEYEPLLKPLCEAILELRSINVSINTFLKDAVDPDERMRTNYKLAGTSTYRLASAGNAFGTGLNLQNLPKGDG